MKNEHLLVSLSFSDGARLIEQVATANPLVA